jgi:uncharacterized membrane protein
MQFSKNRARRRRTAAWGQFVVIFGCVTFALVALGMHPLYASLAGIAVYALFSGVLRE